MRYGIEGFRITGRFRMHGLGLPLALGASVSVGVIHRSWTRHLGLRLRVLRLGFLAAITHPRH